MEVPRAGRLGEEHGRRGIAGRGPAAQAEAKGGHVWRGRAPVAASKADRSIGACEAALSIGDGGCRQAGAAAADP